MARMKEIAICEFEQQLADLNELLPKLIAAGWQEDVAFAQVEAWIFELEVGADFELLYHRAQQVAATTPIICYH